MSNSILVLGANGTVSKHVVAGLLAKGETVKAASQSGKTVDGAVGVKFDYQNPASINNALEGVDRLYLMLPTGFVNIIDMLKPVVDAAIEKNIKVVFQSVFGVDADDSIPYRQVELMLENSGIPLVILRPNWFMDNFVNFWLEGIRHGVIAVPAAEGKSSFIDARDIAAAAVAALTSSEFDGKAFNLTGPEAFSYGEAAALISQAIDMPVQYQAVDDVAFVEILTGAGVPADYAGFLASIFYPVREGWTATVTNDVETLAGRKPYTLAEYIVDYHTALASVKEPAEA